MKFAKKYGGQLGIEPRTTYRLELENSRFLKPGIRDPK
jgi:hypothetical protein